MKMKLITSLYIASFCGFAMAASHCEDKATGYQLKLNFPAGGGMGTSRGTGRLSKSGILLETLRCTSTSGITVTLDCGEKSGYFTSAIGDLQVLPLTHRGVKVATLVCK